MPDSDEETSSGVEPSVDDRGAGRKDRVAGHGGDAGGGDGDGSNDEDGSNDGEGDSSQDLGDDDDSSPEPPPPKPLRKRKYGSPAREQLEDKKAGGKGGYADQAIGRRRRVSAA